MNKYLLRSTVFALSTLLFSLWTFCILINWNHIQNLRSSDPLWLVSGVSPWLYLIIVLYLLLFLVILHNDLKGKLFHLTFISYLVLVIDSTPYFLSTSCRFGDTFGVVQSSTLLPEILSSSIFPEVLSSSTSRSYPESFPVSYMLFYIIHSLAGIDLFFFSRYIFSPLILIGIFTFWYLFIERLFGSKVALISTIIAIPSQLIEISITPNSVGIILVLISFFLCTSKKWNFRALFFVIGVALVLTHAINPIILFTFLLFFYIYINLLKSNILDINLTKIYTLFAVWITWIVSESCIMGTGIIKAIYSIFTLKSKNFNHASTYTTGSGNLIEGFSWIQTLTMYKYELYGLIVAILIILDLYFMNFNPLNINRMSAPKKTDFITKYSFLTLALIFLAVTLCILLLGGSDTENLISRTLNFSMLFVSLFIGYSFNIPLEFSSKIRVCSQVNENNELKNVSTFTSNTGIVLIFSKLINDSQVQNKIINILFIIFLLLAFITYPLYSYSKDSYINFPEPQKVGYNFFDNHLPEKNLDVVEYSKSEYFYQLMHGIHLKEFSINGSNIYTNGWYFLYIKKSELQ